jgi:hypothetical protein
VNTVVMFFSVRTKKLPFRLFQEVARGGRINRVQGGEKPCEHRRNDVNTGGMM